MGKENGLPLGYPPRGTVTTTRIPALTVCEFPGCGLGVTCVVLHVIEDGDHTTYSHLHQLCDAHADEEERAVRRLYTLKPPTATWKC